MIEILKNYMRKKNLCKAFELIYFIPIDGKYHERCRERWKLKLIKNIIDYEHAKTESMDRTCFEIIRK